jgi:hypothetical protein
MLRMTAREELFCRLVSQGYPSRDAAARAGYRTAPERSAAGLIARADVREKIARLAKNHADGIDEAAAGLRRIAFGSVSDAVRLACADEIDPDEIDRMDLFCVSEIKRGKNGVEIKFFDRIRALQCLQEMSHADDDAAEPFYRALEQGAMALNQGGVIKGAEDDRPWS